MALNAETGISNRFTMFSMTWLKLDKKSWKRFQETVIYLLKRFRKKFRYNDYPDKCFIICNV